MQLINWLVQEGQLYWAFPFSKNSLAYFSKDIADVNLKSTILIMRSIDNPSI